MTPCFHLELLELLNTLWSFIDRARILKRRHGKCYWCYSLTGGGGGEEGGKYSWHPQASAGQQSGAPYPM